MLRGLSEKISVIIPCYNEADSLVEVVESVTTAFSVSMVVVAVFCIWLSDRMKAPGAVHRRWRLEKSQV